jgi:hypothetical protein
LRSITVATDVQGKWLLGGLDLIFILLQKVEYLLVLLYVLDHAVSNRVTRPIFDIQYLQAKVFIYIKEEEL